MLHLDINDYLVGMYDENRFAGRNNVEYSSIEWITACVKR